VIIMIMIFIEGDIKMIKEFIQKIFNIHSPSKEWSNIYKIDYYKENLYEVLELFRKTINKDFDDWKDADDWLFSNLNLTEKDISDIYRGRSIVYVASCRKEDE